MFFLIHDLQIRKNCVLGLFTNVLKAKMSLKTFYTILGVDSSATQEEIKRKYQELVKRHHPDKTGLQDSFTFVQIDKAYKVLKDDELRKVYDATILQEDLNNMPLIYAEINVNELEFCDNLGHYPCRCGENYVIPSDILCGRNIFECSECSNNIIVNS